MIKNILKFSLLVLSLIIGLAAGTFFQPSVKHQQKTEADQDQAIEFEYEKNSTNKLDARAANTTGHANHQVTDDAADSDRANSENELAWFAFARQFFVPLLRHGDDSGVIILSMALETDAANLQHLNDHELRIRDVVLRQLFIAANAGRFDGNFTTDGRMRGLRKQILAALQDVYGSKISAVLISDIARQ